MDDTEYVELKLKKYLSKYEYIHNEYTETMYLFVKYKKLFDADVLAAKSKHKDEESNAGSASDSTTNNESKKQVDAETSANEIDVQDRSGCSDGSTNDDRYSETKSEKDGEERVDIRENGETCDNAYILGLMKKLYKLLSLKTHPDKLEEKQKGKGLFNDVNTAYNARDIMKLLYIAKQIGVEFKELHTLYTVCTDSVFDSHVESCINNIIKKTEDIKTTLAWNWAFADEAQKQQYRQRYNLS
jgi:hypothetical protein